MFTAISTAIGSLWWGSEVEATRDADGCAIGLSTSEPAYVAIMVALADYAVAVGLQSDRHPTGNRCQYEGRTTIARNKKRIQQKLKETGVTSPLVGRCWRLQLERAGFGGALIEAAALQRTAKELGEGE